GDEPRASHHRARASDGGGCGLPRPDQPANNWAGRSRGDAEADHRADCAGRAHGACGTRLPAEANRIRFRSQSRHNAREIPASPRSRCCFLDAGGRGARVEDRLTNARQSCSLYLRNSLGLERTSLWVQTLIPSTPVCLLPPGTDIVHETSRLEPRPSLVSIRRGQLEWVHSFSYPSAPLGRTGQRLAYPIFNLNP